MASNSAARRSSTGSSRWVRSAAFAVAAGIASAVYAAPAIPPAFQTITLNGSATGWATGSSTSFLYDSATRTFHMWYRTSDGAITGLNHATSTDGIHFTSGGALSFSVDPFTAGTPPFLYYENAAVVGGSYKLIHWTPSGSQGGFPAYNYDNSVTNIGANPGTLATTHEGAISGGTSGQTGGSFGIVNGGWFGQCGATANQICRAAYTDGSPPSVPASIYPPVIDATALLVGPAAGGYVANHGDVIAGQSGLDAFFTLRTSAGAPADKQVYYANSTNNGTSFTSPGGLFGATPTLDGAALSGNLNHPDAVFNGSQYYLYVSTQNAAGGFVVGVAIGGGATGVPTMGMTGLVLTGLLLAGLAVGALRRGKQS